MKAIYMAALGPVDGEVVAAIDLCLWQTFGVEIRHLPALSDPVYAYDAQRVQYSSTEILRKTLAYTPPDALRLLAVTERDLFIPMLSFVFGHAQLNGAVAVMSLARLRQEFYGLVPNRMLLLARAVKEAMHEVGHTFGLTHCPDPTCPMSLSSTIFQVDRKGDDLCGKCLIILEEHLKHVRTDTEGTQ